MLIFPAAVRAAAEKEDSVIFYLACGTGLCLLVNVGKWLHGEVNDGSAASAYKMVMQAGVCVKVVLSVPEGELLDLSQFYQKV